MWVIQCKSDNLSFWSNQCGWVYRGFDVFSQAEYLTLRLPVDGKWLAWGSLRPRVQDRLTCGLMTSSNCY